MRTRWRLWRGGARPAGGRREAVCSIGAGVFPRCQKPSCAFALGEEEEGRARRRVGGAAGHPGARLPALPRVPCRAVPCRAVPQQSLVHGAPPRRRYRPRALLQLGAPRDLGASPQGGSVPPQVLVHPPGEFLCTPRPWCIPPQGGSVPLEMLVYLPGGFLCTLRPRCIPPRGFCAPRDVGAPPRGFSVHPKTLVHLPRGILCPPRCWCTLLGGSCAP